MIHFYVTFLFKVSNFISIPIEWKLLEKQKTIETYLPDKSESLVDSPMARSCSLIRSFSSFTKWELLFGGAKLKYALAIINWSFITFIFSFTFLGWVRTCWLHLTICLDSSCHNSKPKVQNNLNIVKALTKFRNEKRN